MLPIVLNLFNKLLSIYIYIYIYIYAYLYVNVIYIDKLYLKEYISQ